MRQLLILFLTGIAVAVSGADQRDERQLQTAVRQLQQMGISDRPVMMAETETYAVYGAQTGGFVVVGRQDDGQVLGYSSTVYDAGHMPCGLRWWLGAVDEALQQGATTRRAKKYSPVDNFLKTTWGQGTPYNDQCPRIKKQRPPAGCIATALAQVLRYYEWPAQGQGKGGYYIGDNYVEANVDGVYDWANMPYVSYGATTKSAIKKAVATLVYDCGKATRMAYDLEGSGAIAPDQALALARNFQYDSLALQYCDRVFYSSDQWMEMINAEIQARRPILYAANDKSDAGGHAFVFSGIDEDGKVWVNWGWDGDGDGFYAVDLLDVSGYKFSEEQKMNIGIQPMSAEGPTGSYQSKWAVYYFTNPTVVDKQQLRVSYYYVYNAHFLPFTGDVGLMVESTDGQGYAKLKLLEEMAPEALEYGWGYTNLTDDDSSIEPLVISFDELPTGCYKLTWVSKDVREEVYQVMLNEDSGKLQQPFYLEKAADGTLTLADEEITSDIRQPRTTHDEQPVYYRLDGTRSSKPLRGISIIRQGTQVHKVIR